MNLYEAINQRRTVRDLQDKEIPNEVVQRILNAGLKAPTNDHMRDWEFVVLTDPKERIKVINPIPRNRSVEQINKSLDDYHMTDPCQRGMYLDASQKQYTMLYQSGCLILPFFKQDSPLLQPNNLSSLNGLAAIWCCIENIFLAATAEGLGVAFRIPHEEEIECIKEAIGHPDNYVMPCFISIGYPKENAVKNPQHEFDAKDKIHVNHW